MEQLVLKQCSPYTAEREMIWPRSYVMKALGNCSRVIPAVGSASRRPTGGWNAECHAMVQSANKKALKYVKLELSIKSEVI